MIRRPPRNLYRHVHNGWKGWVFRAKRRGRATTRYFSDLKYGSSRGAHAAAARHRDEMLAALAPLSKIKTRNVLNRTGVVGVCLVRQRSHSGKLFRYYVASWTQAGRRRGRSFSVLKYGAPEARRRAIRARRVAILALLRPSSSSRSIRESAREP
jgi:hypothetical protein